MKFSYLLFFLFWYLPTSLVGNASPNEYIQQKIEAVDLNKTDWEAATKDLSYEGAIKRRKKQAQSDFDGAAIATFFKILMILSVVIVVLLLLRFLIGAQGLVGPTKRKFDPNEKIDTQTVAENIHEFDLTALLQQAINRQEYSVATRLYYLLVIKALSDKALIQWQKDKTNRHYLNELTGVDLKQQFRDLTNIFERVWYGDVAVDAAVFEQIQQPFKAFMRSIGSTT